MKPTAVNAACLAILVSAAGFSSFGRAQAQGSGTDFDLVCYGTGEKLESQTDYDWDRKHHEYREHASLGTAHVGGTAQVEIHASEGSVRLPESLLPPLTTGGRKGWFPINDLQVSADRIQGTLKLNGMNRPKLTIDRRSGRMQIQGMESFDGTCSPYNPGSTRF